MQFDILTLFPEVFPAYFGASILKRAQEAELIQIQVHNIRDHATDKHRVTDDTPFGGGGGMVMKVEPLVRSIEATKGEDDCPVILMSPQGRVFSQKIAYELAALPRIMLVCGRYEGVDERVLDLAITDELSIGDYVLTGGELAAMIIVDAVSRLIPGVLGASEGAAQDSHATGLLEHPHYTRPALFRGLEVPRVLQEGHHAKMMQWRREESLRRTWERRPDLLASAPLTDKDRRFLAQLEKDQQSMKKPSVIAIDGPAGSGKSTICQEIARQYGYVFVDTGAFYRAITVVILRAGIGLEDEMALRAVLDGVKLQFLPDAENDYQVIANGEDVTAELRSHAVESHVSALAKMPIVREALLAIQREVALQGHVILAGRDIGTVILPDAELKIYLDASLTERARRRHLQNLETGKESSLEDVQAEIARRDRIDSERSLAPLSQAEDAIYILTDGKSVAEVVAEVGKYLSADRP